MLNPIQTNHAHRIIFRQTMPLRFGAAPNQAFTDFLSSYIFEGSTDIWHYIENDVSQEFRGIAGDIPPEWQDKIDTNDKKKQFFSKLADFAENAEEISSANTKTVVEQEKNNLINIFKDFGINFQEVTKLMSGTFGIVYLIDNKYALKKFRQNIELYINNPRLKAHGPLIEPNRALFFRKQFPDNKTRRIADLYLADLNAGYMLSEHAEKAQEDRLNPGSIFSENIINEIEHKTGLLYIDKDKSLDNIVGGVLIDCGGFQVTNECRKRGFVYTS